MTKSRKKGKRPDSGKRAPRAVPAAADVGREQDVARTRLGGLAALGRRALWVLLGLLVLLIPLLVFVSMWMSRSLVLENAYRAYTGTPHIFFLAYRKFNEPFTPDTWRHVRNLYFQRTAIETLVRIHSVVLPGLVLGGLLALAGLATHVATRVRRWRWAPRSWWGATLLFAVLEAGLLALAWRTPRIAFFVLPGALGYALNFPLGSAVPRVLEQRVPALLLGLALLCSVALGHLLAPAALLLFAAWSFGGGRLRRAARWLWAGRAVVCLFWAPVLALAFLSARPTPRPESVHRLRATQDLYDVQVDPTGDQLFVTRKLTGRRENPVEVFALAEPRAATRSFILQSIEVEDIALDEERRRVYHVARDTRLLLVVDADTLAPREAVPLPELGTGSTTIGIASKANRLFLLWENDYLVAMDLTTRAYGYEQVKRGGNILVDERHQTVYLHTEVESGPELSAFDVATLTVFNRVPAPAPDRMVLSRKRSELYVADARGARIWVYRTPTLELLRKISAPFGVRALAVDDAHGLLLAASVVFGHLDVIALETGERLQRHYVAEYGRRLAIDAKRRHAFMTATRDGLFMIEY